MFENNFAMLRFDASYMTEKLARLGLLHTQGGPRY